MTHAAKTIGPASGAKAARAANANQPAHPPLSDADRDSVHILPLSIIPLQTKGLERTRMIKNAKLESVIELFDDEKPARARSRSTPSARFSPTSTPRTSRC